jgi:predicted ATPase
MNRFVVISGCSGGGKSTLLAELGRRGHTVIGRRIVIEEMLRLTPARLKESGSEVRQGSL